LKVGRLDGISGEEDKISDSLITKKVNDLRLSRQTLHP